MGIAHSLEASPQVLMLINLNTMPRSMYICVGHGAINTYRTQWTNKGTNRQAESNGQMDGRT